MKPVIETLDDDDIAAAAAIPDDFDAEAYYAGRPTELRELFASAIDAIDANGVIGDTLLDASDRTDSPDRDAVIRDFREAIAGAAWTGSQVNE